jgi:hypothetical protein
MDWAVIRWSSGHGKVLPNLRQKGHVKTCLPLCCDTQDSPRPLVRFDHRFSWPLLFCGRVLPSACQPVVPRNIRWPLPASPA